MYLYADNHSSFELFENESSEFLWDAAVFPLLAWDLVLGGIIDWALKRIKRLRILGVHII